MEFIDIVGVWIAAILTIGITSISFKETFFSRWSEVTYLAMGTLTSIVWFPTDLRRYVLERVAPGGAWIPLGPRGGYLFVIFAVLIGIIAYGRYSRKYFWLYRYYLSLSVGTGIGVAMRGFIGANFLDQIRANFLSLVVPGDAYTSFNNTVMCVVVLSSLIYFIFTFKAIENPTVRRISIIGRYFMMIAFGVTFGTGITTRINQYAGRIEFLIIEWLGIKPIA